MKFRNKILILLVICIGLLIVSGNKSFATYNHIYYPFDNEHICDMDFPVNLDNYNYVLWGQDDYTVNVFYIDKEYHFRFYKNSSGIFLEACNSNGSRANISIDFYYFKFDNSSGSYTLYKEPIDNYIALAYKSSDVSSFINDHGENGSYPVYASSTTVCDFDGLVFREAGNGGTSSGGNDNTNTSNTINSGNTTNTTTNSTSNIGNTTSSSFGTSEGDSWLSSLLKAVFQGFFEGITQPLGQIFTFIGNIFSSIGDILSKVISIFNFLNPNADEFIFKIAWEHLKNILEGIGNILAWIGNFFVNLLDFVYHLFVPTDSQWEAIKSNFEDLKLSIETHIPFWSFIKSTITDAQNTDIIPNDFLIIEIPAMKGFGFYGGSSESTKHINVMKAYEPYRIQIRGLLLLIVYASVFVYIVKLVTDYRANVSGTFMAQNLNDTKDKK
ncbi:MAG: hypothetical protein IJ867_01660 [Clostridia bacterium]|nr:hypothetical protein [Clostridia bacterium]